jgi:hypothetical protein
MLGGVCFAYQAGIAASADGCTGAVRERDPGEKESNHASRLSRFVAKRENSVPCVPVVCSRTAARTTKAERALDWDFTENFLRTHTRRRG